MMTFFRLINFKSLCLVLAVLHGLLQLEYVAATMPECADYRHLFFEPVVNVSSTKYHMALENYVEVHNQYDTIGTEVALQSLHQLYADEELLRKHKKQKTHVPDHIIKDGYPSEAHLVETTDGYILELHRIPYSPKSPKSSKSKIPVFLMHGFLESSNGWIALGPEKSLAYLLADAGYDVWMGNARGTEDSLSHIKFDPNGSGRKEYWSYSWHEIALYDITASIDYVLKTTGHQRLHYIGFSQGTTAFFAMASVRPEYNDKIIMMHALAPVAFLRNTSSLLFDTFNRFYKPMKALFERINVFKFDINNKMLSKIFEFACHMRRRRTPFACKGILAIIDSNQIDCSRFSNILEHTPAGASMRQAYHFVQLMRSGEFRQYDYERARSNQEYYGTSIPPSYNLTQISTPINLFYSKSDPTATHANVMLLKSKLPNVKRTYTVEVDDFRHVDFIYSRYLRNVNYKVINAVKEADTMAN